MKQKTLKALGVNIREARIKSGLTLPELSSKSGVSRGNVSKAEHGSNITVSTLYSLCFAIGIHPIGVMPEFHARPTIKKNKAVWAQWINTLP